MKKQREILKTLNIDKNWSLFLDRDGVINKKIENDYVRNWEQFQFLHDVIEGLKVLRSIFGKIFIVTNQRGIGRKLMTEEDLNDIHRKMLSVFEKNSIYIDGIYFCPHDYNIEKCSCRKPDIGMALKAKEDFPEIDFKRSVMVGDSISDMEFGKRLGMFTVFISEKEVEKEKNIDIVCKSLKEFSDYLKE